MENFAEGELGNEQRRQDAARTQALFSLSDRIIGRDPKTGALSGGKTGDQTYGKVRVWHIKSKQYIILSPIDAAEALAGGGCVLDRPVEDEPETEA